MAVKRLFIGGKPLTLIECQIIWKLISDKTHDEIAGKMDKNVNTVKSRIRLILYKLGMQRAIGLGRWAIDNHFIRKARAFFGKNKFE